MLSAASTYQTDSMPGIVKALIVAGANADAANDEEETALMMAAQAGSVKTIKNLLAAGVAINAKDKQGQTALMYALNGEYRSSGMDVVNVLLAAGANVNAANADGRTALTSVKIIQSNISPAN